LGGEIGAAAEQGLVLPVNDRAQVVNELAQLLEIVLGLGDGWIAQGDNLSFVKSKQLAVNGKQ
jgi:hypothetical protein